MQDYAVINTTSGQYIVKEGDVINIDYNTSLKKDDKISFDILLLSKKGDLKIGDPIVGKVKVHGTILGEIKGKKIDILKSKAKSRYRRHIGHRQKYMQVKIVTI